MCGIVGVIGSRPAAPVILDSLLRLEYRGYDSAGIATLVAANSGRVHGLVLPNDQTNKSLGVDPGVGAMAPAQAGKKR